jgi:hypothetical protein
MRRFWKRSWFWAGSVAGIAALSIVAFCWSHRAWSINEWRVYEAMEHECHPAWKDFHYERIRSGDPVESVIARTEPVRVHRTGRWVILNYQGGFYFTGLTAAAYDGRMVSAYAWSCTWERQFFDIMSQEQRAEFFERQWEQPARVGKQIVVR